jgi:hypothetical protein
MAKRRQLRTKRGQPWPLQWPRGAQPRTQEDDQENRMTLTNCNNKNNCSVTKKRGDDVFNNGGL